MNIFKILSSYDGSIKEPNISSFLAYLLDLNEDHGISDLLLRSIISDFQNINPSFFNKIKTNNLSQFDITINPEYSVFLNNRRRDIDIVIEIYNDNKEDPLYSICLENKITDSSIQKNDSQLKDELEGIQKEYKENGWNTEIYFVFVTLEDSKKSNEEFDVFNYDKKLHLYWKGRTSIQEKLLTILDLERIGEIDPLSEDFKFLIKSFLSFIKTDFKSSAEEKTDKFEKKNYGKPVIEFFRDYVATLEINKDYKVSEIKKEIAKLIKKESGLEIKSGTLNCHTYVSIVNEKNRLHYSVTEKNNEYKNLLYYPDVNNKEIVRKFTPDLKDITIYVK